MSTVCFNTSFAHEYELEQDIELCGLDPRVFYYPGATRSGGRDGIIIRLQPTGSDTWIGVFKFGYASPKAINGLFSCPSARHLCVVSSGAGYIVDVNQPELWKGLPFMPICYAAPVPELGLLVFADFTTLFAYGTRGAAWTSPKLSWDGIEITRITSKQISGRGWDAPANREAEFTIDTGTGHICTYQ